MPHYLTKFSYTPETWARLIGNPENRQEAAQEYIESVGEGCTDSGTPSGSTMATPCGRPRTTCRWPRLRWRSAGAAR